MDIGYWNTPSRIWDTGTPLPEYGILGHPFQNMGYWDTPSRIWDTGTPLPEYGILGHPFQNMGYWDTPSRIWDTGTPLPEYGILGHPFQNMGYWDTPSRIWDTGIPLPGPLRSPQADRVNCLTHHMTSCKQSPATVLLQIKDDCFCDIFMFEKCGLTLA